MILINSGAYVNPEFQAELGKVPPCFLPVGNKKLIEFQVETLKKNFPLQNIFLTLPQSYEILEDEKSLLTNLNVTYIESYDELSLSEAILYALNISQESSDNETVKLLHGDTLLKDPFPDNEDCIGVSEPITNYNWQTAFSEYERPYVWNGYFSFSSKRKLIQCLALTHGQFVKAIELYNTFKELKPHKFLLWYDFGHINTYFRSRSKLTTERAFNSLSIESNTLRKQGTPPIKIKAESYWFQNIPNFLKIYTPQIISWMHTEKDNYYELEYLPILPLNELLVHGKKKNFEWIHIISRVEDFLKKCKITTIQPDLFETIQEEFREIVITKTYSRILSYAESNHIDLNRPFIVNDVSIPCVNEIIEDCIEKILSIDPSPGILHGDLCFSNLLFDSRADQIKVIDPRGLNNKNQLTIYGDQKYDIAKLSHSINGLYDFIIAGRYRYHEISSYHLNLEFSIEKNLVSFQQQFLESSIVGIEVIKIQPLVVLLFLSMLPLHSDRPDRQKALFTNALKIYSEIM